MTAQSPQASPLAGQPYIASALKLRVAKAITSTSAGRIIGPLARHRIRHYGLRFDVASADFSPRVRAQLFWGSYESAETKMIQRFLQGSGTVVELGSSIGITAAHIAAVMAPNGHLVCVEANPRLLPGIRERVTSHGRSVRLDDIHAAVATSTGTGNLALAAETTGSKLTDSAAGWEVIDVPTMTLGEILRQTGVSEYDLVSDVEGAETAFLLQDSSSLAGCRHAVMELHDTAIDDRRVSVADLIEGARAAGFRLVSRHGPVVYMDRS